MSYPKPFRLVGAVVVLTALPLLAASAQTSPPTPPSPNASPPSATKPDAAPTAPATPMAKPSSPTDTPATAPRRPDRSAATPGKTNPLVGLAVFSSDGSKMGTVHSVSAAPDGSVKAIHLKTGGFLGFGGKLVAIPEGRFTKNGDNIQLGISADEVNKLPEIKEQS